MMKKKITYRLAATLLALTYCYSPGPETSRFGFVAPSSSNLTIPAERLSATGYGEYQPITVGDLERNRRIEMKLTQR